MVPLKTLTAGLAGQPGQPSDWTAFVSVTPSSLHGTEPLQFRATMGTAFLTCEEPPAIIFGYLLRSDKGHTYVTYIVIANRRPDIHSTVNLSTYMV